MYIYPDKSVKRALDILRAFKEGDIKKLRNISDELLADGAVGNDKNLIKMAVISHALSKILEKEYYRRDKKYWKRFVENIEKELEECAKDPGSIKKLEEEIVRLDNHFGRYSDTVLYRSKIRRGSTLYAWGISLTLASKLVDVPEAEIMRHSGKTKMIDEDGVSKSAEERMKVAEEVL